jgi:hypothetical protein
MKTFRYILGSLLIAGLAFAAAAPIFAHLTIWR